MTTLLHLSHFRFINIVTALLIFGTSFCASGRAFSPNISPQVDSFDVIDAYVARMNRAYSSDDVLIVLDIDNTLMTSTSDLGGDFWYQWQSGKLAIKPGEGTRNDKVACLHQDATGLLFELLPMKPTESDLPDRIKQWQKNGNTVIALTARDPINRAATERELKRLGFLFTASALTPRGEFAPVYRDSIEYEGNGSTREWSYMRGIMMVSGMDKGKMLQLLLDKTKRAFSAIIFVDDHEKNVRNVANAFEQDSAVKLKAFHYTKIENERKDLNEKAGFGRVIVTQQQAEKMAEEFDRLQETLEVIFPGRTREACHCECLR